MNRSTRRITTPNRSRYMSTINHLYYAPQTQPAVKEPKKTINMMLAVAIVFLFVGLGIGYLTYPFLDTADWVTAEQIGAEAVPTVDQTLASIAPADVVAYVNKHKDLFPSLVQQPTKTEAPKPAVKPAPKPALEVLVDNSKLNMFKISYLPQYFRLFAEEGVAVENELGDSDSGRVRDLKTVYSGNNLYLYWNTKSGVGAQAKMYPDGRVEWLGDQGYTQLDVERAIQLMVDTTRRDSCGQE